jgi:hypothetical protein
MSRSANVVHQQRQVEMATKAQEALDYNNNEKGWISLIRGTICKQFWHMKQFHFVAGDDCMGSTWQRQVCDWAKIPKAHVNRFWNKTGQQSARKQIRLRRQNTTNAMKKVFLGKAVEGLRQKNKVRD